MLNIDSLTKSYRDIIALKNVTLELSLNEILAIVGPSGCGKTTLLRLIAGLESPDEGRIHIDGIEVSSKIHLIEPHKRKLSMIFQDLALWPHMTVKGHLEFVLGKDSLLHNNADVIIGQILRDVNLSGYDDRRPHELSGGEKQRLAIARSLASKPTYLLMDEPFSSLDSIIKDDLQELVLGMSKNHKIGIMYVTHNIEEALILADRIGVMNHGKLEQIDTKDNILNDPKDDFVRRILRIK